VEQEDECLEIDIASDRPLLCLDVHRRAKDTSPTAPRIPIEADKMKYKNESVRTPVSRAWRRFAALATTSAFVVSFVHASAPCLFGVSLPLF
jgi:hypothetical protein